MHRISRASTLLALVVVMLAGALAPTSAQARRSFPERVELPDGFAPEGIVVGRGTTFYTGSLVGAGIWRGDLRSGEGSLLVEGGGPYAGMDVDARGRLWVAGGPSGLGYVFDTTTGASLATMTLAPGAAFVNDVIVTREAAYFTDSFVPRLIRVPIGANGSIGVPEVIDLDPAAIGFVAGAFNLNGIVATPDGGELITVNSTEGGLYRIDTETWAVAEIDLGGASAAFGDGLLLAGRSLFVVRNQLNAVAEFEIDPAQGSAALVDQLSVPEFDVPTTVARFGASLYVVNARFGTPMLPMTEYWVTRVDR